MMHDKITMPNMSAPRVKGHMKIQLHDAETGELTQEIERDNYVAEQWFENHSRISQWSFGQLIGSASTDFDKARVAARATNDSSGIDSDSFPTTVPFCGLFLSDYSGAVDTTEQIPKGVPAGCASLNFTSSGTFAGTYNADESEHSRTYHRFVYDFATTQGNGTIQSIYTGDFESNNGGQTGVRATAASASLSHRYVKDSMLLRISPSKKYLLCTLTNGTSVYGGSTSVQRVDHFIHSTGLNQSVTLPNPGGDSASGTNKGSKYLWLDEMNTSTRELKVFSMEWADIEAEFDAGNYDLSGVAYSTEHTFDAADLAQFGISNASYQDWVVHGLEYLPETDSFLLGMTYNGNNQTGVTTGLWEFDAATWAVTHEYTNASVTEANANLCAIPGEPDYVWRGGSMIHLNRGTDEIRTIMRLSDVTSGGRIGVNMLPDITIFSGAGMTSSYGSHRSVASQMFFSRVRLDNPVVKDNTNTMKVVYEFTIDTPNIFG